MNKVAKAVLFFLPLICAAVFCVADTFWPVQPVKLPQNPKSDGTKTKVARALEGWATINSQGELVAISSARSFRWPMVTLAVQNFDRWIMDAAYANPKLMGEMLTLQELQEFDGGLSRGIEEYSELSATKTGKAARQEEEKKGNVQNQASEQWKQHLDAVEAAAKKSALEAEKKRLAGYYPLVRNRYNAWNLAMRAQVRLMIAGHVFQSIEPFDVTSPTVNGAGADSWNLFVFKVQPSEEEREDWNKLVRMVNARCHAKISIAMQVGEDWARMSSSVNSSDSSLLDPKAKTGSTEQTSSAVSASQQFTLWLRPAAMQALAVGAALQVLMLVLVFAHCTSVLRDAPSAALALGQAAPWSLSRVTLAWWLMLCTASYLYVWAMTDNVNNLSGSAAILLGINGATLLFATARQSSPSVSATPGTPPPPASPPLASRGFLLDLISEGGEPEASRMQMLVWNGVLGLVFAWQTVATWTMPTFDATLMTLLGISSTAYVGFKFAK